MQQSNSLASVLSLALITGVLFAGAPAHSAPVKAKRPNAVHTYNVGSTTFTGTAKTVCFIEGKWSDGEPFSYDTWDACAKMNVTRGTQADYKVERPRGTDKRFSGKDIPEGSEVFAISNDYSVVLVFRDHNGIQREILIRD